MIFRYFYYAPKMSGRINEKKGFSYVKKYSELATQV